MASKKVAARAADRHNQLVSLLAVMACGAISGAAVLFSIGVLARRWFSLAPSQAPLAVAGSLMGMGVALVALALSSSASGKDSAFDAMMVWAAADPALRTPMTWAPAPIFLLHAPLPLDSRAMAFRRERVAARRCAARRPGFVRSVGSRRNARLPVHRVGAYRVRPCSQAKN